MSNVDNSCITRFDVFIQKAIYIKATFLSKAFVNSSNTTISGCVAKKIVI